MIGHDQRQIARMERRFERRLVSNTELFFDGRTRTDTRAIRKRYRSSGFNPASTIRRRLERRLKGRGRKMVPHKVLPGRGRKVTTSLVLGALALLTVEALLGRAQLTLQLAGLLLAPFVLLYLALGLPFAMAFCNRLTHLGFRALGFLLPAALLMPNTQQIMRRYGITADPYRQ